MVSSLVFNVNANIVVHILKAASAAFVYIKISAEERL